ncbi:calcium-binding protein [Rhodosalinus sediminis]|uniref:Calcium-binding protein n=1 Tax=Rhodosalinus sediminis TaxID=1940533 RepID=A0A3D9BL56_9RHOB|nr:calcium-binding protein [Rhodosalinus sediminis]REC54248.1 calcium-binding protein [Rhodosalinus sediminis]
MAKDFADSNRLEDEAGLQAANTVSTADAKQDITSRFVAMWEKKNAQRALRGGAVSTMALTLAACGGDGDDPVAPAEPEDQTAVQASGRVFLQQLDAVTTVDTSAIEQLPDNLSLTTAETAGALESFVDALKVVDVEAQYLDVTGSNGDDTFYADTFAVHNIDIVAGEGTDTLEVNMKGPWAQVGSLDGVEVVNVVNNENNYLVSKMAGWDIDVNELEPTIDSADVATNSILDLFTAPDLEKLVISEGSFNFDAAADPFATLEVRNVNATAEVELQGSFSQDTLVTVKGGAGALDLTLSDFFVEDTTTDIELMHNTSVVNLTSTSTDDNGVNDINGIVFQNELRILNISGDAELNAGNDDNRLVFDGDRTATIDASALQADLLLEVAPHTDVNYTGTDQTTGVDSLTVSGADDSGETRLSLIADFGAGSTAVNNLTIDATDDGGSGTTILNSDTAVTADIGAGITLEIDGDGNDAVDATRGDLSGVGAVVFGTTDQLQLTAGQVDAIGIANFSTKDSVNDDGQLAIVDVDSTTDLDLSAIDNGDLVSVRTLDGADVTLTASTVLGNLKAGVGAVEIMAETDDASLTMTADQFQQLDDDEVVVSGIDGVGNPGNNPATNTPFEGTLTLTDVAEDEVIVLDNVEVDGVTVEVGAAGETFVATDEFAVTDGGNEDVTLEVSGETDLTQANLDGVDIIKLVDDADLTLTTAQGNTVLFDGTGSVTVDQGLTINTGDADTAETSTAGVRFVFSGETNTTPTLTLEGANDIAIRGIETGSAVTQFTLDDNTTAGETTITGGTPAFNLAPETTQLTLDVLDADSGLVIGGGDDTNADYVAPGLETLIVEQNNVDSTIDLGSLGSGDSVASNLSVDVTNPSTDTPPVIELKDVPADADYTLNGTTVIVNEGATIGAGSSLNLESTTKVEGSIAKDALPIAADSTFQLTSDYTAAEITTLLDTLAGPTAAVDVTDMTAAQLTAVAAAVEKVDTANVVGSLYIDKDVAAADITTIVGLADFTAGDNSASAELTGMSAEQINAVGATTEWDTDGLSGTFTLTADNAAVIGDILGDTIRSADVTIDAGETADNARISGTDLRDIAGEIAVVDTLTNLTYDANADDTEANGGLGAADDGLEARALLGKTTDAAVDATGISTDEKVAIAENIDSVAADGIENLSINTDDAASTITSLLTNAVDAGVDATAGNAGALTSDQLSAIAANASSIADGGISNLTVTSDQTAAEITALLGRAATPTVDLTDMTSDQVDAVEAAIGSVDALSGETTAAVLQQLDTADTEVLDATSVGPVTGSLEDLQAVADADEGVVTLNLAADVAFNANDADGTVIDVADVNTLNAETTGTITFENAVVIEGARSALATDLVNGNAAFVDGDDGVVAATADLNITDAGDAAALDASDLRNLGGVTTGTVTVANNTAITGTETTLTDALVTADTRVETTSSDVTVTNVNAVTTEDEQQVIEDIDAATTGVVTVVGTGMSDPLNFDGYEGEALVINGGTGDDTITGTSNNDTIDGEAGADVLSGGEGDDTIAADDNDTSVDGGSGSDTMQLANDAAFDAAELDNVETVELASDAEVTVDYTDVKGADNIAAVTGVDDGNDEKLIVTGASAGGGSVTLDYSAGLTLTDALLEVQGGSDDEDITGTAGDDALDGDQGADTLSGGDGDDTLAGGAGADSLNGGAGTDELTGGAGNDSMTGGAGDDQFTVDAGDDEITDFGDADRVDIANGASLAATVTTNYTAAAAGDIDNAAVVTDAVFTVEDGIDFDASAATDTTNGITITATTNGAGSILVGTDQGDAIIGGNGDDELTGGAGIDSLSGGDGDDTFIITDADDDVASEVIDGTDGGDGIADNDTIDINTDEAIDLSDDTITDVETLDLGDADNDADVTLTDAQLSAFTTVTADDQDSITIDELDGAVSGTDAIDTFVFASTDSGVTISDFSSASEADVLDLDLTGVDGTVYAESGSGNIDTGAAGVFVADFDVTNAAANMSASDLFTALTGDAASAEAASEVSYAVVKADHDNASSDAFVFKTTVNGAGNGFSSIDLITTLSDFGDISNLAEGNFDGVSAP